MAYSLFLFDADDTLFDFQASEKLSFALAMQFFGLSEFDAIYGTYREHGAVLWRKFEQGLVNIEHVKTERFKLTFSAHNLDLCSLQASKTYLEILSENVLLVEHATEICQFLSERGEVGIITNGVEAVQRRRLKNSGLSPYISFMAASEECGFAKPDTRFFEYTTRMAKNFSKPSTLVIGDRYEADIEGAHAYGVDACWYNPHQRKASSGVAPKHVISHLSELKHLV